MLKYEELRNRNNRQEHYVLKPYWESFVLKVRVKSMRPVKSICFLNI